MDYVIFDEAVCNSEWRGGMEAQRFFDGRLEVWQRRSILETRQSLAAHDSVQLRLNALLHAGEENHGQQERGDARRRLCHKKELSLFVPALFASLLTDSVPAG